MSNITATEIRDLLPPNYTIQCSHCEEDNIGCEWSRYSTQKYDFYCNNCDGIWLEPDQIEIFNNHEDHTEVVCLLSEFINTRTGVILRALEAMPIEKI